MKSKIFHSLNIFFLFIFFFLIDFSLSKIFYKKNHCYNFQYFDNGHYYDLKKNCKSRFRFKSGFPTVNFFTDDYGLRVGDQNKIKQETKKNIFLFGDSFTFGVGLEYEDTFAGILESNLPQYNFYNFAVGSYSPTVHLYRLNKALDAGLSPEKIILFLDLTDVIDESQRWFYDKNLKSPIRPEERVNKRKNFFQQNFKLSNEIINISRYSLGVVKNKISNLRDINKGVKTSIQGQFTYTNLNNLDKRFWKKNDFEKGLKNIRFNISEISKISKKINAEFFIAVYPWAETLYYGQEYFNWVNFAKDICNKNKCKTIDSFPIFQQYKQKNKDWSSKLYFIGDEHFNKQGAKLLANAVLMKIND